MAMENFQEQRIKDLSLEDSPPPRQSTTNTLASSSPSSLDEIWRTITASSHPVSNPNPNLHLNPFHRSSKCSTVSSSSACLSHSAHPKAGGEIGRPGSHTLKRAQEHVNGFHLVKALKFLIDESPPSSQLQYYQDALKVQQRKRQHVLVSRQRKRSLKVVPEG